jgi:beta propeller repeat protein
MGNTSTKKFLLFWFLLLILPSFIVCPTTAAGTETLITTLNNGMDHRLPKIYGDQIVWQDSISGSDIGIVYVYNITSGVETQVSDTTDYNYNPAIYGNNVVWTDCGSYNSCINPFTLSQSNSIIYLYNISSGITTQISDGSSWQDYPAIYGNRIVWQDNRNPTSQIYINGTSPGLEKQVNATTSDQNYPNIYGDQVVWQDDLNLIGNTAIYLFNITSSKTAQISDGSSLQEFPTIYGNRVVWQDNRNGNYEIFTNGTTPGDEYSLTPNEPSIVHQYPAISSNWVAWVQTDTTKFDIDVNDTSTSQTIPIALDREGVDLTSISFSPADSLYWIVWDELDSSGYNVYLYTNTSNGACPVAGFTNNFAGGSAPVNVAFTDTSSQSTSITHWFWDFGDGNTSTLENPTNTYYANKSYTVSLTVSNSLCRNTTTVTNSVIVGQPVAGFTASPTSGVVNTPITFTDTSIGNPTQWNWSWGDGPPTSWTNGTTQNPTHSYANPGSYTVSLTASNAYGSNTITRTGYITVLAGANELADTTINGITPQYHGSQQYLVFNDATLTDWTFYPNSSVLDFEPPSGGFQNISIYTTDSAGFLVFPGNSTIVGNISSVQLQTKNIIPTGFSASTGGPFCSVNYSIDLPTYPDNAILNTQVWEQATPSDNTSFNNIAAGSHFSGRNGTAYTAQILKTNFPAGGTAHLYMSVNASLVASKPYGRNEVYVERIDDSGQYGEVLGTHYLYHNSTENLDYFEADSPEGLSTFGLSFLEGAGNVLQLVTLSVSSQVSSGSYGSGGGSIPSSGSPAGAPAAVQNPAVPQEKAPPPQLDMGKTVNLYINANSVITQATTLQSNDNLATLSIGQGIVAQEPSGKALSSVTITGLTASEVPSAAKSATYSFAGMAYDLQPSGATFSPAITLTFTIPGAQWGKEYTIQSYDHTTNTWQGLPTTYDASKGTISAQVSHFCCFALFEKPVALAPPAGAPTGVSQKAIAAPAPPAPTAMSTFIGIIVWISETGNGHIDLVAIAVIAVIALLFAQQRRRRRRRDLLR